MYRVKPFRFIRFQQLLQDSSLIVLLLPVTIRTRFDYFLEKLKMLSLSEHLFHLRLVFVAVIYFHNENRFGEYVKETTTPSG